MLVMNNANIMKRSEPPITALLAYTNAVDESECQVGQFV